MYAQVFTESNKSKLLIYYNKHKQHTTVSTDATRQKKVEKLLMKEDSGTLTPPYIIHTFRLFHASLEKVWSINSCDKI